MDLIPVIQIRPKIAVMYQRWEGQSSRKRGSETRRINMQQARKTAYSGTMSTGAKKRLLKAINLLSQYAQPKKIYNPVIQKHHYHRLSFVTLTVSDSTKNYTAQEAYKMLLRPLLQWLTKYRHVKLYIWKAEIQERGQIHYHLVTPTFIHYLELRDKWNTLQLKNGLLDNYIKKYNKTDPNSTDIHSTRKVKNIADYLAKYLSKDNQNQQATTGKVWDCSYNLKAGKYFDTEVDSTISNNIQEGISKGYIEEIIRDYCVILRFKKRQPAEILGITHTHQYKTHIANLALLPAERPKRTRYIPPDLTTLGLLNYPKSYNLN